jgi:hypothetical protein
MKDDNEDERDAGEGRSTRDGGGRGTTTTTTDNTPHGGETAGTQGHDARRSTHDSTPNPCHEHCSWGGKGCNVRGTGGRGDNGDAAIMGQWGQPENRDTGTRGVAGMRPTTTAPAQPALAFAGRFFFFGSNKPPEAPSQREWGAKISLVVQIESSSIAWTTWSSTCGRFRVTRTIARM